LVTTSRVLAGEARVDATGAEATLAAVRRLRVF